MSHNDFHVEPQYVGMNYNHFTATGTVSGICILLERYGAMGTICLRSMAELLRVSQPHASGLWETIWGYLILGPVRWLGLRIQVQSARTGLKSGSDGFVGCRIFL